MSRSSAYFMHKNNNNNNDYSCEDEPIFENGVESYGSPFMENPNHSDQEDQGLCSIIDKMKKPDMRFR